METIDPRRDLTIQRDLPVTPPQIWRAWSDPDQLARWWAPAPATAEVEALDLRPGGAFRIVVRSAEGVEHLLDGTFLRIDPERRIQFTDALTEGWRPGLGGFLTADIRLERLPEGGVRYAARVLHRSDADRAKHETMGFHQRWARAIDQLGAVAAAL